MYKLKPLQNFPGHEIPNNFNLHCFKVPGHMPAGKQLFCTIFLSTPLRRGRTHVMQNFRDNKDDFIVEIVWFYKLFLKTLRPSQDLLKLGGLDKCRSSKR